MKLLRLYYYCGQILRFLLCIPASAANAAAVNPNGSKTLLANGLITLFIKGNPVLRNGPKSLQRNHPDSIIFDNLDFDNLISVDAFLAKALRTFSTYLLSSELPIIFDDSLKTTSVSFFIANFHFILG